MAKNFKRSLFILISLFILLSFGIIDAQAVTKYEFLSGLLKARGINWSESPEFQNNNPAGFILRTGYITEAVTNLNANITRREALRWCIESLGLKFEAEILSDYPSGFKDSGNLTPFERGCLVIASVMNPVIITKSDNFRGNENLSSKEFNAILERVSDASRNLTLDVVRNPLEGLRVLIHRQGVPTGIPSWRVYMDGIKTKTAAETFRNSLRSEGLEVNTTYSDGIYGVRSQKLEDYNQVRRLETISKSRGLNIRILPSMANINTSIVPKFWVMLKIDPSYWRILPLVSRSGARELKKLSELSKINGTTASINAGFFAITTPGKGYPIGALKINGQFLSKPYDGRGCLGWNNDDIAVFQVASENVNEWYDMENIIQAGPLLIDEGFPANIDEGFNSSFLSTRHPRSAVGLNQNGEWVFMVYDGRNGLHSSGATISELTDVMRANGVLYALNLDGGGSTEIIINGKIYNFPSDGHERKISYGLGVVPIK